MDDSFDLRSLVDEFRSEAREQLDELDRALLLIEDGGTLNDEQRRALLRALHTLKGNSAMLGLRPIAEQVHALENAVKVEGEGGGIQSLDPVFELSAALRSALARLGGPDQDAALARVAAVDLRARPPNPAHPRSGPITPPAPPTGDLTASPVPRTGDESSPGSGEILRVQFGKLDELLARVAEMTPALVKGPSRPSQFEIVVIGASTGGPRALGEILTRLPEEFPVGIVIAQHMPAGFTTTLAERFDRRSALTVSEAADGDEVKPGSVLVAPGGKQITLIRKDGGMLVRVDDGPSNLLHRPSVDLLFGSAAEVVGARAIGVVLTGMGDDGARGLRILHDAGARTIAESQESAVIFGMPRAAAPAADLILPLREMSSCLTKLVAGELSGSGRTS